MHPTVKYGLIILLGLLILMLIFFYPLGRMMGGLLSESAYGAVIAAYPAELAADQRVRRDGYVAYQDTPVCLRQAIISVEDKRFYSHSGIDPFAATRVLFENMRDDGIDHGGSTITQQLARAILKIPRQQPHVFAHISSRLAVLRGSLVLEHYFGKEKILELYLNSIYFGRGATGIGAAASAYFGKQLPELTEAQCIYLAGLPQAPTTFGLDPSGSYTMERYRHVIATMARNGYLSAERAGALRTDILFSP